MKRLLLAAMGALAVVSLEGCYADVAPYSYGPVYGAPAYYAPAPVYPTTYVAPAYRPAYVAPGYQPAPAYRSGYVAPPRVGYRTAVVAPRYGRHW